MPLANQKGVAPVIIIGLVLIGLILGVGLIQTRTNILPHASEEIQTPQTAFQLFTDNYKSNYKRPFQIGDEIRVNVAVASDIELANTFLAEISYPADLLEVTSIVKETLVPGQKNSKIDDKILGLIKSSPSDRQQMIKDYNLNVKGEKVFIELRVAKKGLTASDLQYKDYGFEEESRSEEYLVIGGFADIDKIAKMADNPNISYVSLVIGPDSGPILLSNNVSSSASISLNSPNPACDTDSECGNGYFCADHHWMICKENTPGCKTGVCVKKQPEAMNCMGYDCLPNSTTVPMPIVVPSEPETIPNYFIQFWLPDTGFNNETGNITLSGGVSSLGIKTTPSLARPVMATIIFKAKKAGEAKLQITKDSLILRNSDSANILNQTSDLLIKIKDPNKPQIRGDLDGDGVVGYKDFSIFLSNWKSKNLIADVNGDGQVNIFDFSILLANWSGRRSNPI